MASDFRKRTRKGFWKGKPISFINLWSVLFSTSLPPSTPSIYEITRGIIQMMNLYFLWCVHLSLSHQLANKHWLYRPSGDNFNYKLYYSLDSHLASIFWGSACYSDIFRKRYLMSHIDIGYLLILSIISNKLDILLQVQKSKHCKTTKFWNRITTSLKLLIKWIIDLSKGKDKH